MVAAFVCSLNRNRPYVRHDRMFAAFCMAAVLVLAIAEMSGAEQPSVNIFAGCGRPALTDGVDTKAAFNQPFGICLDATGRLYVADSANHCVRKILPDGVVTTFAGSGQKGTVDGPPGEVRFNTPSGVRVDGKDNLYVFSYEENSIRRRQCGRRGHALGRQRPDPG